MEIDANAVRGLDRETVRRLSCRSDARGMGQLVLHILLLCGTGLLVGDRRGSLLIVPGIVLHGIVLIFLFRVRNESIHRTAFERVDQ